MVDKAEKGLTDFENGLINYLIIQKCKKISSKCKKIEIMSKKIRVIKN